MGLVFEHQEPVLCLSVHLRRDMDGAGVDLLALIQLRKLAPPFQGLCTDGGDVHEGLGAGGAVIRTVNLLPQGKITPISGGDAGILNLDAVQMGGKGGVAAVIGPVGVHHPQLRHCGIPVFLVPKILLQKQQVVFVHGQPHAVEQLDQGGLIHLQKAFHRGNRGRRLRLQGQRLRLFQGGLPGLHRVDDVMLHRCQVVVA